SRGNSFVSSFARQLTQWDNFETTNEIDCVIGDQSAFGCADRNGKIGYDAFGIGLASVAVDSARQIHRKDVSVPLATTAIDFARQAGDWLTQRRLGTKTK